MTLILIVVISQTAFAQKAFRGELKLGTPNVIGFAAEYQLDIPISGVAPYLDFTSFTLDLDETVSLGISYVGFGAKLYLDEFIGKPGFFAGLGFGRLGLTFTDTGYSTIDYDTWEEIGGKGEVTLNVNMLQLKIGKRWMFGPLTLAVETGYALGKLDDDFDITIKYEDGTSETITESAADIPIGGGTIGALSIGFAF